MDSATKPKKLSADARKELAADDLDAVQLRRAFEAIWQRPGVANSCHFNWWSARFRNGHGRPVLTAHKGKRARNREATKLGKIGFRPNQTACFAFMEVLRAKER